MVELAWKGSYLFPKNAQCVFGGGSISEWAEAVLRKSRKHREILIVVTPRETLFGADKHPAQTTLRATGAHVWPCLGALTGSWGEKCGFFPMFCIL